MFLMGTYYHICGITDRMSVIGKEKSSFLVKCGITDIKSVIEEDMRFTLAKCGIM